MKILAALILSGEAGKNKSREKNKNGKSCEALDDIFVNYLNHYKWFFDQEPLTLHEARENCLKIGESWDIAIPNSETEDKYFKELTKACFSSNTFWMGLKYAENELETTTVFDKVPDFVVKWPKSDQMDETKACVQYRKGTYSHLNCENSLQNYICENHNYLESCQEWIFIEIQHIK